MGVLTDLVVLDRSKAQEVCNSLCPWRDFDGINAKGLDPVKLGTLHAILAGTDFDPSALGELLASAGDDGPWVYDVPTDLTRRLATLDPQKFSTIGAEWAATEEFRLDGWAEDDVQAVLREIANLCQRAVAEGKPVLMWMSL